MAVVQRAGAGEPPIGGIVALALGFALVAAVLVAELTERVGLPRVTGYLLLGLVCGPYVGNLITHAMARELGIFNGLAVAVIAFMAGLEMNLQRLRSSLRELVALTLTTLAVMYVLLLPVLWAAWPLARHRTRCGRFRAPGARDRAHGRRHQLLAHGDDRGSHREPGTRTAERCHPDHGDLCRPGADSVVHGGHAVRCVGHGARDQP